MSVVNLKDDKLSLQSSGAKNVTTPNLKDPDVLKAMDKIKFTMGLSHLGESSNKSKSPMALVSEPGSLKPFKNSQEIIVADNDRHGGGGSCSGGSGHSEPSSECSHAVSKNFPRTHIGERFNPETISELNYFAFET